MGMDPVARVITLMPDRGLEENLGVVVSVERAAIRGAVEDRAPGQRPGRRASRGGALAVLTAVVPCIPRRGLARSAGTRVVLAGHRRTVLPVRLVAVGRDQDLPEVAHRNGQAAGIARFAQG